MRCGSNRYGAAQDDTLRPAVGVEAVGDGECGDAGGAGVISQCQRQEADRRALPTGTEDAAVTVLRLSHARNAKVMVDRNQDFGAHHLSDASVTENPGF